MTVREEGAYNSALLKISNDLAFVNIVQDEAVRVKGVLIQRKEILEKKKKKQDEEACTSNTNSKLKK